MVPFFLLFTTADEIVQTEDGTYRKHPSIFLKMVYIMPSLAMPIV